MHLLDDKGREATIANLSRLCPPKSSRAVDPNGTRSTLPAIRWLPSSPATIEKADDVAGDLAFAVGFDLLNRKADREVAHYLSVPRCWVYVVGGYQMRFRHSRCDSPVKYEEIVLRTITKEDPPSQGYVDDKTLIG